MLTGSPTNEAKNTALHTARQMSLLGFLLITSLIRPVVYHFQNLITLALS